MRVDILKYLQSRTLPTFIRRESAKLASKVKERAGYFTGGKRPVADEVPVGDNKVGTGVMANSIENKYSPLRLLLVLALTILLSGLFKRYVFQWFPGLQSMDMPLVGSAMLIALLAPVLYLFFYRPMVRQLNRLKKAEVKMQVLALNDMLTGLYNRRGFMTFANQLLKLSNRAQRGLILIYADLDNLKQINDDYGHEAGDGALISVADVLKKTFRDSDIIGRVGGDEFAVLAVEAKTESQNALRKRLKENLDSSQNITASRYKLTISLGIIYYEPEKPQPIEELLKRADILMYEEKLFKTMPRPTPLSVGR